MYFHVQNNLMYISNVDLSDARPDEVVDEVFDLFVALDADASQLDFPILFASGRQGWADAALDGPRHDLGALFDLVVRHVPAPNLDAEAPFAMVASILEYDNFLGRVLTGRVEQGRARLNMPVKVLRSGSPSRTQEVNPSDGRVVETGRLTKLLAFRGLDRVAVEE